MDEYLTIDELSTRIKFSRQGIYNLIHKKILVRQIHYFKPTPKKLLFSWAAMQEWIRGDSTDVHNTVADRPSVSTSRSQVTESPSGRIKI